MLFSFMSLAVLLVLLAIAVVIWGLVTRRSSAKRLALLAAAGMGICILGYVAFIWIWLARAGNGYESAEPEQIRARLAMLVEEIERYKQTGNGYPHSLRQLYAAPGNTFQAPVFDPAHETQVPSREQTFYKLIHSTHYHLFTVGEDGEPYTGDDITLDIATLPRNETGFVQHQ